MTGFLKLYGVSLLAFLALDTAWLGLVARNFYREQLDDLLRPDPRWGAALPFITGALAATGYPAAACLGVME